MYIYIEKKIKNKSDKLFLNWHFFKIWFNELIIPEIVEGKINNQI